MTAACFTLRWKAGPLSSSGLEKEAKGAVGRKPGAGSLMTDWPQCVGNSDLPVYAGGCTCTDVGRMWKPSDPSDGDGLPYLDLAAL